MQPGSGAGCGPGEFDLLHIHEPITPSIALLALWAADVPVVATFHTATPRSRSMQLAGGALRASIEKIDAGIAVSESARRVVVQHLGRDAVVIPNGFGFAEFADPATLSGNWSESQRHADEACPCRKSTVSGMEGCDRG